MCSRHLFVEVRRLESGRGAEAVRRPHRILHRITNPARVLACPPSPRCPIPLGAGEEESREGVTVGDWVVE